MTLLKTNIKGTDVALTSTIYDAIEGAVKQISKYAVGHKIDLVQAEVGRTTEHHRKGDVYFAELQLLHPQTKKAEFRARETDETIPKAVRAVRDDLIRQLRRAKDRAIKHGRK